MCRQYRYLADIYGIKICNKGHIEPAISNINHTMHCVSGISIWYDICDMDWYSSILKPYLQTKKYWRDEAVDKQ